jgi:hypothetical protein
MFAPLPIETSSPQKRISISQARPRHRDRHIARTTSALPQAQNIHRPGKPAVRGVMNRVTATDEGVR